ncbi:hypothetical protein QUB63_02800 [Microcoleus sp. ARI1-B5]|uniref:hypothetical protein n=1 Tax=unclassified Microcoleus TaxID=2642155 RepID=UPI002FCF813C
MLLNSSGEPRKRFQIVAGGSGDAALRPIHTCHSRPDASSSLICQDYKRAENSDPQQPTKSRFFLLFNK